MLTIRMYFTCGSYVCDSFFFPYSFLLLLLMPLACLIISLLFEVLLIMIVTLI